MQTARSGRAEHVDFLRSAEERRVVDGVERRADGEPAFGGAEQRRRAAAADAGRRERERMTCRE